MAKSPYAELPGPLKQKLPAMFASYPNLNKDKPSSWIMWSGEKVVDFTLDICHAKMAHASSGWDEMVTAVPNSSEVALEYLRMLVRGPFRSMSDLIRLDRVKDNYYLHLLSLSKWSANVLMNFCIASRVPIEHKFMLEPWAKRCELGFNPTLAFLLTYSYGSDANQKIGTERDFSFYRSGHMWLDPSSSWSQIIQGVITGQSASYKIRPASCRPTNVIWGHCKDYVQLKLMSDDEISEFYTQPIEVYEKPPIPVVKKKLPFNYINAVGEINAAQAAGAVNFVNQIMPGGPAHPFPDIHDEVELNVQAPLAHAPNDQPEPFEGFWQENEDEPLEDDF